MDKSRRSLLKTIGVAGGVGLAGCISDGDETKPGKPESKLFIQEGENAEVEKTTAGYRVTLQNVDSRVTWFGDRPERNTGEVSTQQFVDSWSRYGFTDTPPNAAVTGIHDGERKIVTVELKTPQYNRRKNTLTYTARKLSRNPGGNLERLHDSKESIDGSSRLSEPNLYIDPANHVTILKRFQEVNKKGNISFGNNPQPNTSSAVSSEADSGKMVDISSYVELGDGLKNPRLKITKRDGDRKLGVIVVEDSGGDTRRIPREKTEQAWFDYHDKWRVLPSFQFYLEGMGSGRKGLKANFRGKDADRHVWIDGSYEPKLEEGKEGGLKLKIRGGKTITVRGGVNLDKLYTYPHIGDKASVSSLMQVGRHNDYNPCSKKDTDTYLKVKSVDTSKDYGVLVKGRLHYKGSCKLDHRGSFNFSHSWPMKKGGRVKMKDNDSGNYTKPKNPEFRLRLTSRGSGSIMDPKAYLSMAYGKNHETVNTIATQKHKMIFEVQRGTHSNFTVDDIPNSPIDYVWNQGGSGGGSQRKKISLPDSLDFLPDECEATLLVDEERSPVSYKLEADGNIRWEYILHKGDKEAYVGQLSVDCGPSDAKFGHVPSDSDTVKDTVTRTGAECKSGLEDKDEIYFVWPKNPDFDTLEKNARKYLPLISTLGKGKNVTVPAQVFVYKSQSDHGWVNAWKVKVNNGKIWIAYPGYLPHADFHKWFNKKYNNLCWTYNKADQPGVTKKVPICKKARNGDKYRSISALSPNGRGGRKIPCLPNETVYVPSYSELKKSGRRHIHNKDNVNKKKKYKKIYVRLLEHDKHVAKKKAKKKKLEHDDMKQLSKIFRKGQLKIWKKSVKKVLKDPDKYECDDDVADSGGMTKSNFAAYVHRTQRRIHNAGGVKLSNVKHSSKLMSKSALERKSKKELISMAKPLTKTIQKNALSPCTMCDPDEDDPDEDLDADPAWDDADAGEDIAEITEDVAEVAGEDAAGEEGAEIAAEVAVGLAEALILI